MSSSIGVPLSVMPIGMRNRFLVRPARACWVCAGSHVSRSSMPSSWGSSKLATIGSETSVVPPSRYGAIVRASAVALGMLSWSGTHIGVRLSWPVRSVRTISTFSSVTSSRRVARPIPGTESSRSSTAVLRYPVPASRDSADTSTPSSTITT